MNSSERYVNVSRNVIHHLILLMASSQKEVKHITGELQLCLWWESENPYYIIMLYTQEYNIVLCCAVLHRFSCVRLCAILWSVAHQAPLSMGFSRQEYWSGLLCPPPGDLPYPRTELASLMSPILAGEFFTISTIWEAPNILLYNM